MAVPLIASAPVGVLPSSAMAIREEVNKPTSIDVAFAFGGFTSPGGHPLLVVRRNVERGIWSESEGEGAFFYEIADEEDLDRKWTGFLGYGPDFVKGYLLYSGELQIRAEDPAFVGWRGLHPRLLEALTRRAHRAGLHVSAHVETVHDFCHALDAGVDEINHLPGFRGNEKNRFPDLELFLLEERDTRRAAAEDVVVVTTLGDFEEFEDQGVARRAEEVLRSNLTTLEDHGVRLAIGSDDYSSVGVSEAFQLRELGITRRLLGRTGDPSARETRRHLRPVRGTSRAPARVRNSPGRWAP